MAEVAVARLAPGDAGALADLLGRAPAGYIADFFPFPFDRDSLHERLAAARADRYWALRVDAELAGFAMLRGLDAGYARPSFGVYVAPERAGRGLARLAVAHAQAWAACNGIAEILLKVAHGNARARALYERAGFLAAGDCPDTGHLVMTWRAVTHPVPADQSS